MSQPNRAQQLLDQLPKDLTVVEIQELQTRLNEIVLRLSSLEARQRKVHNANALQKKYPGLRALLESGRAKLGEPKTGPLYAPTGARLPAGVTAQDLLDQDRADC